MARVSTLATIAVVGVLSCGADDAHALAGRLGIHGLRMEPNGAAEHLGKASWGGGIEGIFEIPGTYHLLAGCAGVEIVNFDTSEQTYKPGPFAFERTLSTSQDLTRLFVGLQFGPHGSGLLQPFVGVHGSLAWHTVSTTLSERFDDPDQNRSQTNSESDFGLGYDATVGLHLNVFNRFGVYGGARYLHLYGITQPIGDDARTIDPEYVEGFAGISLNFGLLEDLGR